eukprot:10559005-Ditylum_brightwellii.AAC.1
MEEDNVPRWRLEMSRKKNHLNGDGKIVGFGSYYNREPGNYSNCEFSAKQGHRDRVHTADCTRKDKAE